jgi:hypothetical protein
MTVMVVISIECNIVHNIGITTMKTTMIIVVVTVIVMIIKSDRHKDNNVTMITVTVLEEIDFETF